MSLNYDKKHVTDRTLQYAISQCYFSNSQTKQILCPVVYCRSIMTTSTAINKATIATSAVTMTTSCLFLTYCPHLQSVGIIEESITRFVQSGGDLEEARKEMELQRKQSSLLSVVGGVVKRSTSITRKFSTDSVSSTDSRRSSIEQSGPPTDNRNEKRPSMTEKPPMVVMSRLQSVDEEAKDSVDEATMQAVDEEANMEEINEETSRPEGTE